MNRFNEPINAFLKKDLSNIDVVGLNTISTLSGSGGLQLTDIIDISSNKIKDNLIPHIAITDVSVVATIIERDALTSQETGDVVYVGETNRWYIRTAILNEYLELTPPQISQLGSLQDVELFGLQAGDHLIYDGISWKNSPQIYPSISELGDVIISSIQTNDILKYNGSKFVNSPLNVFNDGDFTLKNSINNTKITKFSNINQASSTTKIIQLPTNNCVLASTELTELFKNKDLSDISNEIGPINKIRTSTSHVLISNVSPTVGQTLVAQSATSAIWATVGGGSTFNDNAFEITDDITPSKKIKFQCSGITTTRTLAAPDLDGTIMLTSGNQVVTNKDLTSATNIIYARQFQGNTGAVSVSGVNPVYGQVLTASGANSCLWQSVASVTDKLTLLRDIDASNLSSNKTLISGYDAYPNIMLDGQITEYTKTGVLVTTTTPVPRLDVIASGNSTLWVGISLDTQTNPIWRSLDQGTTWTRVTTGNYSTFTSALNRNVNFFTSDSRCMPITSSLLWSQGHGKFYTVNFQGGGASGQNRILSSPDGLTWTSILTVGNTVKDCYLVLLESTGHLYLKSHPNGGAGHRLWNNVIWTVLPTISGFDGSGWSALSFACPSLGFDYLITGDGYTMRYAKYSGGTVINWQTMNGMSGKFFAYSKKFDRLYINGDSNCKIFDNASTLSDLIFANIRTPLAFPQQSNMICNPLYGDIMFCFPQSNFSTPYLYNMRTETQLAGFISVGDASSNCIQSLEKIGFAFQTPSSGAIAIDALTDVTITSRQNGDIILCTGSEFVNLPRGSNNQVLTIDNTNVNYVSWKNKDIVFTPIITTPTIGQIMMYNGTNWTNKDKFGLVNTYTNLPVNPMVYNINLTSGISFISVPYTTCFNHTITVAGNYTISCRLAIEYLGPASTISYMQIYNSTYLTELGLKSNESTSTGAKGSMNLEIIRYLDVGVVVELRYKAVRSTTGSAGPSIWQNINDITSQMRIYQFN